MKKIVPEKVLTDAKTYLTYQLQRKLRGEESNEELMYSLKDLKDAIEILIRCKKMLVSKKKIKLTVSEITKEFENFRRDRVSQFGKK